MEHLIIALEAPMMSFGGHRTNETGPTWSFPALSALTGLLGNAMGWSRTDPRLLQDLQDHLVAGSRIDRDPQAGFPHTDYQTAKLNLHDIGWSTSGQPETRYGEPRTYSGSHPMLREYIPDARLTTALRLTPSPPSANLPTLHQLAEALIRPARPLFIGRKPFIPSIRIFQELREADNILQALLETPVPDLTELPDEVRLSWPADEGDPWSTGLFTTSQHQLPDLRNWHTRLHGGTRQVTEATAPKHIFQESAFAQ